MIRLAALALCACATVPVGKGRPAGGTPVVYFVLVDRFANGDPANDHGADPSLPGAYHGGDLAGLRERLPDLAALGVDVVWISPVVDNIDHPVRGGGFPDWGYHGYWAQDFTRVDEHLGTERDLVALVAEAHRLGLRVILDVVLNHPGYGSRWERDPAWTRSPARGDCGRTPETECLFGLPDFRTEDDRVAAQVIEWQLDWVRKSGADGVRLDAARHVSEVVRDRFIAGVRRIRPGALVLSEIWGTHPGSAEATRALRSADAVFDFSFADQVLGFVTHGDATRFAAYLAGRRDGERFVTFLDTHDTPGFLHRAGGDRQALLLGLVALATVPGIPLLYYGDEVARPGGEWPANRSDMPWGEDDGGVRDKVVKLLAARRWLEGPLVIERAAGPVLVYRRGESRIVLNAGSTSAELPVQGREVLGWGATLEAGRLVVPARSAAIVAK